MSASPGPSRPVQASKQLAVPTEMIGGLPIAVIDRAQSARLMAEFAFERRNGGEPPLIFTSANGQVVSMCAQDSEVRELFTAADLIHADGMPLVFTSRLLSGRPLPERVATTDLFHDLAKIAPERRTTFYMLGGAPPVIDQAVQRAQPVSCARHRGLSRRVFRP